MDSGVVALSKIHWCILHIAYCTLNVACCKLQVQYFSNELLAVLPENTMAVLPFCNLILRIQWLCCPP